MNHPLFTSSMRLSQIVEINPRLVLLLPRLGMSLGTGDNTIRELCRANGVPDGFFTLLCNVYSFDGYVPSEKELAGIDMKLLPSYLFKSHRYYMDDRIAHIEAHLSKIVCQLPQSAGEALTSFFSDYKRELEEHFAYEESSVFPHIESLLSGCVDTTYSIDDFVEAHNNMQDKLRDLTAVLYSFPVIGLEEPVEVVYDIMELVHDLDRHSFIEEKIMVPYVKSLERKEASSEAEALKSAGEELSEREKDVLVLVAKGLMSKEIADRLNISVHTVNTHRKNITAKTGIKSVAGLTVYAMMRNML